jgi:hypothetical protein
LFSLALTRLRVQRRAMTRGPSPRRGGAGVLTAFVLIAAAAMVFAPNLAGAWIGAIVGEVWATALGALSALLSGLFGGG